MLALAVPSDSIGPAIGDLDVIPATRDWTVTLVGAAQTTVVGHESSWDAATGSRIWEYNRKIGDTQAVLFTAVAQAESRDLDGKASAVKGSAKPRSKGRPPRRRGRAGA